MFLQISQRLTKSEVFFMQVGSLGEFVFEVSDEVALTLDNFKRDSKARYAEHKIIGRPAILEFLGRELESIKFTMIFAKSLGISDLLQEVHKLREMCWNGTAEFFCLNNHLYTENKMIIESVGEDVKHFSGSGEHILTEVDVSLKEYVETLNDA